jgi:ribonuclease P protein component
MAYSAERTIVAPSSRGTLGGVRAEGTPTGSGDRVNRPVKKETLNKRDRIRAKADFDRLRKGGIRFSDDAFALVLLPNAVGFSRLGIAVPKRIGGAVVRNRVKRLIREVFRTRRDELPRSVDMLVIVKSLPGSLSLAVFRARILALAERYAAAGGHLNNE